MERVRGIKDWGKCFNGEWHAPAMSGAIIRFRNEAFSSEGMLATIVARNSQTEEYPNYAYSTLCAMGDEGK